MQVKTKIMMSLIVGCFLLHPVDAHAAVAEPQIIAEEVVVRSMPEYICVVPDQPSTGQYRYIVNDGVICIKDSDGNVFAKEYTGSDTSKRIYVYTPSKDGLIPLLNSNGEKIAVALV